MMTCKLSDVRRQSDRSSWKMESLEGRMEDNAQKMGRGHPPLDRDKTPGPCGLWGRIYIYILFLFDIAYPFPSSWSIIYCGGHDLPSAQSLLNSSTSVILMES